MCVLLRRWPSRCLLSRLFFFFFKTVSKNCAATPSFVNFWLLFYGAEKTTTKTVFFLIHKNYPCIRFMAHNQNCMLLQFCAMTFYCSFITIYMHILYMHMLLYIHLFQHSFETEHLYMITKKKEVPPPLSLDLPCTMFKLMTMFQIISFFPDYIC